MCHSSAPYARIIVEIAHPPAFTSHPHHVFPIAAYRFHSTHGIQSSLSFPHVLPTHPPVPSTVYFYNKVLVFNKHKQLMLSCYPSTACCFPSLRDPFLILSLAALVHDPSSSSWMSNLATGIHMEYLRSSLGREYETRGNLGMSS